MRLEALHLALEHANQLALRGAKLASNAAQRGGRVVLDGAVLENRLARCAASSAGAAISASTQRREHRAHHRRALWIAQAQSACGATTAAASPRRMSSRPVQTLPITRSRASGAVRSGIGSGRHGSSPDDRVAHRRDARVLARRARRRPSSARARECCAAPRSDVGKAGDHVEHARELEHGERVRVHPQFPSSASSLDPSGRPRRSRGQLFADDRVDRAALRASLELGHHFAHHRADVRRAAVDRGDDRGADLVVADAGRKIRVRASRLRCARWPRGRRGRPCRTSRSTRAGA